MKPICAQPSFSAPLSGALILWDGDTPVQYILEGIDMTLATAYGGTGRIDLSARVAGENFVAPAPEVQTVADLSLGMLHETRVRVTTEEGIHEGVLHDIATETSSIFYGGTIGRRYLTDIELVIGDARIPAKTTDLVEVIKEEA